MEVSVTNADSFLGNMAEKNYENRSSFAKVITKNRSGYFLKYGVDIWPVDSPSPCLCHVCMSTHRLKFKVIRWKILLK